MGMMVWSVLLVMVASLWGARHWVIWRTRREQIPLSSRSYDGHPADPPMVSVLIAAKDEQANIETAVRTMLEQDYPRFELIVINDRSTDRTPEILDSLAREQPDGRLKVIHIKTLRDGWFGKNNAMREGVEHARGEWLCFGDADCRQTSNRTLSIAMQHVLARGIDFLSILPKLETHSLWEQIIQPVCGAVMLLWFNPRDVNNPRHAAAYANGAFMLMSRACYEAIGGHDGVRTQVNEDMHLARLAKQGGRRLYVIDNEDLYTVRMYTRFAEIWRGWSRIFYGCFGTFRRLRVSMMMLIVANVFPYGSALIAAMMIARHGWSDVGFGWQAVAAASALCIIMQQSIVIRLYREMRANPWLAPTFIIGAVVCIGILANSMLKLKGRAVTSWRGTNYRGEKVV